MRKIIIILILSFLVVGMLWSGKSEQPKSNADAALHPDALHPRVEQVISYLLTKSHYQRKEVNDSLSAQIFNDYLEALDYQRQYFLKSDITGFEKYRYTLDEALNAGDLSAAYEMFNIIKIRFEERAKFVENALQQEFDFSRDEYCLLDRSKAPWAKTPAQLDSIWRQKLKNEALGLKLAGKDWPGIKKMLLDRYKNYEKRMQQTQSEDVFQLYMNTFSEAFDPHTNYMSPKVSDDFKIRMSLSLEGIGATLRTEDEYTKVVDIVPGGPADKSGLLHPNDRISAVGQGDNGEIVDVIGWRIDDVVQLIRGPKDTKVRLQIIKADAPPDAPPEIIAILRDRVKLSDRAAKSDTLHIYDNGKQRTIGVIEIPDFYFDYEAMHKGDESYASTSRDVARLMEDLQTKKVDGVIIDLRNNGGGFLNEAVDLTGLFIEQGPVVQVRDAVGRVKVERDSDPSIIYNGPLAVLVDRLSASASEIFAAAIQDYKRGIIVGDQTYGKGTVQNMVQLDRFFPKSEGKFGQVKMTIAKFYRINGGSTQHVGVIPDIVMPSRFSAMQIGESNSKNALLWDEIDAVNYQFFSGKLVSQLPRLRKQHEARVARDQNFKNYMDEIKEIEKSRLEKMISLQEEKRKNARAEAEGKKEAREKLQKLTGKDKEDLLLAETAQLLTDWIALESGK